MCARIIVTILLWLCAVSPAAATLRADLNGDCRVDIQDLSILMSEWMQEEDCEMSLGDELVTNGGFDSEDSWSESGGWGNWSITGGIAVCTGAAYLQQNIAIENGKSYQVIFTITQYDGSNIQINLNDAAGSQYSQLGTFSETIIASGGDLLTGLSIYGGGGLVFGESISIDNVSVREILPGGGIPSSMLMDYLEP